MPAAASNLPSSLVLVGAGKMGGAMLEGWLSVGLAPEALTVVEPQPSETIAALCRARGVRLNPQGGKPAAPAVAVLAIKPQMLEAASPHIADLVGPDTLVVSILAGKTIADLQARLPRARAIVRAMPNLPASIGRGATGAFANAATSAEQRATAQALLESVGTVEWVEDEGLIDAVTALSGSGPAYVFQMVECLARAGAAAGLPADLAERLARATVAGSGALLAESALSASTLRENVTSPGGTTAAALEVLMAADGLDALLRKAVAAAKRRAQELAG
jgi:pyrroline-5-carboxylate reductase